MDYPICHSVHTHSHDQVASDSIELSYDARFLRRKVLHTNSGIPFLLDLEHTTSLAHGDHLKLSDGTLIEVIAATEALYAITGPDLVRLAWHVGNRHTPCQIESNRLVIQRNPVMLDMLQKLGADVTEIEEPFTPEGGAYGHGRTHGHAH